MSLPEITLPAEDGKDPDTGWPVAKSITLPDGTYVLVRKEKLDRDVLAAALGDGPWETYSEDNRNFLRGKADEILAHLES